MEEKEENNVLLRDYDRGEGHSPAADVFSNDYLAPVNGTPRGNAYSKFSTARLPERILAFSIRSSKAFGLYLLPSFIYPWESKTPAKPIHPTAYLDGLRGVAAATVVVAHYSAQFAPALYEGWGSGGKFNKVENTMILQLPVLRVVVSGHFMVFLFFIMSGCVLSIKGLKLARQGKHFELSKTMASSIFRRWVRLFLPVIASMVIAMLISRAQLWTRLPKNWRDAPVDITARATPTATATPTPTSSGKPQPTGPTRLNWYFYMAPKMSTWTKQLINLTKFASNVCNPFRFGVIVGDPGPYNAGAVLWTIPGEFLGSMIVFLVIMGLAWATPRFRFVMILLLSMYCHLAHKWDIALFLEGMLIADLMLIRDAKSARTANLPRSQAGELTPRSTRAKKLITALWIFMLFTGVWLGSIPYIYPETSWGYVWLVKHIPKWYGPRDKFYPALGSTLVMIALTYYRPVQRFFAWPFMRYLGRISFSLYLLHSQILVSIGIPIMTACMRFVGGAHTTSGYLMGLTLGSAILWPFTICVADLFTRAVDEKSVDLARYLAERFLVFTD